MTEWERVHQGRATDGWGGHPDGRDAVPVFQSITTLPMRSTHASTRGRRVLSRSPARRAIPTEFHRLRRTLDPRPALAQVLAECRLEQARKVAAVQADIHKFVIGHTREFRNGLTVTEPRDDACDLPGQPCREAGFPGPGRSSGRCVQVRLFPFGVDIAQAGKLKRELGISGLSAHDKYPYKPGCYATSGGGAPSGYDAVQHRSECAQVKSQIA
jgi:hypothetical protein